MSFQDSIPNNLSANGFGVDRKLVVLFANTDWYLFNFRLPLALELRDRGFDVLLLSPPGRYADLLLSMGFRWQAVDLHRRSLNPLREALLIWKLVRIFLDMKPALVHSFTIKCAVYGSLAARIARVPARVNAVAGMGYVFTSSDLTASLLRPLVRGLLKLALGGRSSRLILQNPDDRNQFVDAGLVPPERVRLIYGSGVDCVKFSPARSLGEVETVHVLMPSRVLWDKGVAEFIDAARILKNDGFKLKFCLAGEPDPGNPASVPKELILDWVSEGVLDWLGHVDDMPSLLQRVQIVVLPSYREGLPKGLIEAAACGCAIVTTDVPGCREVVEDGVDGFLVPVKDAAALASAISSLARSSELRSRIGKAARAKAESTFEVSDVNSRTFAVYGELLKDA